MHPHIPPDRTESDSLEFGDARAPADRRLATERSRFLAAMFMAALVLAAVVAIVLLL